LAPTNLLQKEYPYLMRPFHLNSKPFEFLLVYFFVTILFLAMSIR